MRTLGRITWLAAAGLVVASILAPVGWSASPEAEEPYRSPAAVAASQDGRLLYIACATAERVVVFDTAGRKVLKEIRVPESPSGLALSADGGTLFVTCAAPESTVCVINLAQAAVTSKLAFASKLELRRST